MHPIQKSNSTITIDFPMSHLLPKQSQGIQEKLSLCKTCQFPLYRTICLFCSSELPTLEPKEQREKQNIKLRKMITSIDSDKTLYIFCLDNSKSVTFEYRYEGGEEKGKQKQKHEGYGDLSKLKHAIGDKNFEQLITKINIETLKEHQDTLIDLISCGIDVADVVAQLQTEKKNNITADSCWKSRKEIMKSIVLDIVDTLKKQKQNCDVIVTFFGDTLSSQGIEDVYLQFLNEGDEQSAFEYGQREAKNLKIYKPAQFEEIKGLFKSGDEQSGTALGPAIVFNCGVAAELGYSRNQIIVITDGAANLGFGKMEDIKKHHATEAYQASQVYKKIAQTYLTPNKTIVNLLGFSDSEIKMYIMKSFLDLSGSISRVLKIHQQKFKNELIPTLTRKEEKEAKHWFKNEIINFPKKMFWGTRVAVVSSDPSLILKNEVYGEKDTEMISFKCGILSSKQNLVVKAILPEGAEFEFDQAIEITIIVETQYDKELIRTIESKSVVPRPKPKVEIQKFPVVFKEEIKHVQNSASEEPSQPKKLYYVDDEKTSSSRRHIYGFDDDM